MRPAAADIDAGLNIHARALEVDAERLSLVLAIHPVGVEHEEMSPYNVTTYHSMSDADTCLDDLFVINAKD